MDLNKFISDNECPVCGNKLILYAQAIGGVCFKSSSVKDGKVEFVQHIPEHSGNEEAHRFILEAKVKDEALVYMPERLRDKYDSFPFYLFQLCNQDSLKVKTSSMSIDKYEINAFKVCCYRSTKRMHLSSTIKDKNLIEFVLPNLESTSLRSERFGFSRWVNDLQKVYILSLDYDTNSSRLWYYSCTEQDLRNKEFEPKIFFKDIGALKKRMDFRNVDSLMDVFDSRILLS